MMVIGYDSDTIEYDTRAPEQSYAALNIKQDTTSMEKYTLQSRLRPTLDDIKSSSTYIVASVPLVEVVGPNV